MACPGLKLLHLNDMSVKIYHNPRCSKSRQTLDIIQNNNIELEIIKYLETPPSVQELTDILDMLGLEPDDIMRKREAEYKAAGLDKPNLSRKQKIELMVQYPKVIERPIVVNNGKAALGRPPEQVKNIL